MRAYKANMIPGGVTPTINVSQYDNDYAVTVTLIEGAEIYTPPAGATIRVEGTKPDGHGFEYPCTYQGNVVTMPIYTQMTAVAGRFPIELVVYQSGLRVGSCNIIFSVERAPLGEGTDISETVIPDIIAGAQAQADAAAASATQAASSAASAETAKDAAMDAAQDAIDAAQELQTAIQFNAALIHETASGAVASFSDGADNIPMQSVVAEITPVQSGTGDPSPTNIRPISGRTGMTVTAANKNLAPNYAGQSSHTSAGITWTYNDDGSITLDGTATSNVYSRAIAGISTQIYLPRGTYKKNVVRIGTNQYYGLYVQYYKSSSDWVTVTGGGIVSETFTIDEDYPLVIRVGITNGTTLNNMRFEPYIYPESIGDTTWVSPTKTEIPITWESIAGTVYGGTLDVVSGVLTVTHTMLAVDGVTSGQKFTEKSSVTTADIYGIQAPNGYNLGVKGAYISKAVGRTNNFVCDIANYDDFVTAGREYVYYVVFANASGNGISLRLSFPLSYGLDTVDKANAYLKQLYDAGTPVQFVYPLATPQTYQLTPTEVRTILGGNTIYTDAGDVSVEYVADTKLYIDNKIAELQALVLEN